MEFIEFEGKSLDDAVSQACERMDVLKEDLDVQIISEELNTKSFFGFMRNKEKRVKIQAALKNKEKGFFLRPKEFLEGILKKLDINAMVDEKIEGDKILLNIKGVQRDGGLLIGKGGQTLDALQYLVNKSVNRSEKKFMLVVVDVDGYRLKKQEALSSLALHLGEKVKKYGRPVSTKPMSSSDRKVVHFTLSAAGGVITRSEGRGFYKKILILPKNRLDG